MYPIIRVTRGWGRKLPPQERRHLSTNSPKRLEQDQAKSGFTGLLLSIGAMVASTTSDVILKALETVPTKKVLAWCKEELGRSIQAKRQDVFAFHSKSEQKWEQSWAAG